MEHILTDTFKSLKRFKKFIFKKQEIINKKEKEIQLYELKSIKELELLEVKNNIWRNVCNNMYSLSL